MGQGFIIRRSASENYKQFVYGELSAVCNSQQSSFVIGGGGIDALPKAFSLLVDGVIENSNGRFDADFFMTYSKDGVNEIRCSVGSGGSYGGPVGSMEVSLTGDGLKIKTSGVVLYSGTVVGGLFVF